MKKTLFAQHYYTGTCTGDNTLSTSWDRTTVHSSLTAAAAANDEDAGPEADRWHADRRALLPTDDVRRLDILMRGPPVLTNDDGGGW